MEKNCKVQTSEAMRSIIGQISKVLEIRLDEYDNGYSFNRETQTRFKMDNEVDRIDALKSICEAVTMLAEHVHNKMPYMNFVRDDKGEIYEEQTLLKKLKKEQKLSD